jgi:hypothetical protein
MMKMVFEYEIGDFLLMNERMEIVAVSGNEDFWDSPEAQPSVAETDAYMIVEVTTLQNATLCAECDGSGSVINEDLYPDVLCMECPQCHGWCYTTNLNVKVS